MKGRTRRAVRRATEAASVAAVIVIADLVGRFVQNAAKRGVFKTMRRMRKQRAGKRGRGT